MKVNRRDFLKAASAGLLLPSSALISPTEAFGSRTSPLAILQGATDETSTQIAVLHHISLSLEFFAIATKELIKPAAVAEFSFPGSEWIVSQIYFNMLSAETEYEFHAILDGNTTIDRRSFRTLDLSRRNVRIATLSCCHDLVRHRGIWQRLWESNPDMIFFLGDSVYADWSGARQKTADPSQLWHRYVETRLRLEGFYQSRLIPSLAVWDDHDYGKNNSDRSYVHKDLTKKIFETFFAQDPKYCSALSSGPGIARHFRAFGQEFFFLDGRSFRCPSYSKEDDAMFGVEQKRWFYDRLGTATQPSWVISGSQFFGKYRAKDSFEHLYNEQFHAFTDEIRKAGLPVGFMSGDVHFSEVLKIEKDFLNYSGLELTSSSMHSFTFPGQHRRFRNPRRVEATSYHNFVVVDINPGVEDLELSIQSVRTRTSAFRTGFHLHA